MTWLDFIQIVNSDLRYHCSNTVLSKITTFAFNTSFRLLLNYRLGVILGAKKNKMYSLWRLYLRHKQITKYGCYISYNAKIGEGIRFAHPVGIIIGDKVEIHNQVKIWQHVTLGSHGKSDADKSYPVIEDGVRIFANAVVFGGITIGRGASIAASSVVFKDVPAEHVAIGNPASIKK